MSCIPSRLNGESTHLRVNKFFNSRPSTDNIYRFALLDDRVSLGLDIYISRPSDTRSSSNANL